MVTDEEYNALKSKVDDLEKQLNLLAQRYNSLYMKSDVRSVSVVEQEKQGKHRDVTKYEFERHLLNKRQLVLACVKKYIRDNKITQASELKDVFPDYVQGSLGIVKRVEEAEVYANASKRFYFQDKDIIHLEDGEYTVCSQWDSGNINRFLNLIDDLGYKVNIVKRKYQ